MASDKRALNYLGWSKDELSEEMALSSQLFGLQVVKIHIKLHIKNRFIDPRGEWDTGIALRLNEQLQGPGPCASLKMGN